MAKAAPFVPKPAVEKLPLAVRKDIRDKFEEEKEELESKISELLGTPFHININANEVWAYSAPDHYSAGGILKGYTQGFISALTKFIKKYGDDGKLHFNEAVTKSELTLNVNELGDKAETITADVKDGVFRILFHHQKLGSNQSYLEDPLLNAVEAVPREGFSVIAKKSIQEHYLDLIDDLTATIGEILAMPDVVLDPNFEENYAALTKGNPDKWHWSFGRVTLNYFDGGLRKQLLSQGFKGDDMLQEGLAEILESKTFKLRVVPKTKNNEAVETVLEGGVVYIQVPPTRWGNSTSYAGEALVNLL